MDLDDGTDGIAPVEAQHLRARFNGWFQVQKIDRLLLTSARHGRRRTREATLRDFGIEDDAEITDPNAPPRVPIPPELLARLTGLWPAVVSWASMTDGPEPWKFLRWRALARRRDLFAGLTGTGEDRAVRQLTPASEQALRASFVHLRTINVDARAWLDDTSVLLNGEDLSSPEIVDLVAATVEIAARRVLAGMGSRLDGPLPSSRSVQPDDLVDEEEDEATDTGLAASGVIGTLELAAPTEPGAGTDMDTARLWVDNMTGVARLWDGWVEEFTNGGDDANTVVVAEMDDTVRPHPFPVISTEIADIARRDSAAQWPTTTGVGSAALLLLTVATAVPLAGPLADRLVVLQLADRELRRLARAASAYALVLPGSFTSRSDLLTSARQAALALAENSLETAKQEGASLVRVLPILLERIRTHAANGQSMLDNRRWGPEWAPRLRTVYKSIGDLALTGAPPDHIGDRGGDLSLDAWLWAVSKWADPVIAPEVGTGTEAATFRSALSSTITRLHQLQSRTAGGGLAAYMLRDVVWDSANNRPFATFLAASPAVELIALVGTTAETARLETELESLFTSIAVPDEAAALAEDAMVVDGATLGVSTTQPSPTATAYITTFMLHSMREYAAFATGAISYMLTRTQRFRALLRAAEGAGPRIQIGDLVPRASSALTAGAVEIVNGDPRSSGEGRLRTHDVFALAALDESAADALGRMAAVAALIATQRRSALDRANHAVELANQSYDTTLAAAKRIFGIPSPPLSIEEVIGRAVATDYLDRIGGGLAKRRKLLSSSPPRRW